jgi:hypothetical protein
MLVRAKPKRTLNQCRQGNRGEREFILDPKLHKISMGYLL